LPARQVYAPFANFRFVPIGEDGKVGLEGTGIHNSGIFLLIRLLFSIHGEKDVLTDCPVQNPWLIDNKLVNGKIMHAMLPNLLGQIGNFASEANISIGL
jgi:hypothetical protein